MAPPVPSGRAPGPTGSGTGGRPSPRPTGRSPRRTGTGGGRYSVCPVGLRPFAKRDSKWQGKGLVGGRKVSSFFSCKETQCGKVWSGRVYLGRKMWGKERGGKIVNEMSGRVVFME